MERNRAVGAAAAPARDPGTVASIGGTVSSDRTGGPTGVRRRGRGRRPDGWGSEEDVALETEEHQRRRPGRPRNEAADDAIMDAVVELLTESGFRGVTIDAVAQRAGVGRATIYRRWAGKEQLVLDALTAGRFPFPQPDTGNLRDDLLAYYLPLADAEAQRGAVRLMPALAAEAAVDSELAARLHAYVSDRRAPVAGILYRAQERGEIGDGYDVELVVDLLTGAIMYRLYFSGAPVDEDVIHRLIEGVLIGIGHAVDG